MGDTKIEWTRNADGTAGKTWNPIRARHKVTGKIGWLCEHVSEGCRNCYAEKMNLNTYFGNGVEYKPAALDQVELFLDEKILQQPLHWRKPTNVFPCSMTDLFGSWVEDEWLDAIHSVMYRASRHTFQCLTKRADRQYEYVSRSAFLTNDPPPNIWRGVSVEDQKTADERIPLLMDTPAAVRWISAEPLLGLIDLESVPTMEGSIDWVVVGGESGPRARPMHPDWARSLRDQCVAAGVPFFFKQWGEWLPGQNDPLPKEYQHRHGYNQQVAHWQDGNWGLRKPKNPQSNYVIFRPDGSLFEGFQSQETRGEVAGFAIRVGKKAAGRTLDGRTWDEFPELKAVTA